MNMHGLIHFRRRGLSGLPSVWIVLLALLWYPTTTRAQFSLHNIEIYSVSRALNKDTVVAGQAIVFRFMITNITLAGDGLVFISNAFKITSPDGACWGGVQAAFADTITSGVFDPPSIDIYSGDGSGVDTVAFYAGGGLATCGLPVDYIGAAFEITIGPISPVYDGKTITIDSCTSTPTGEWLWVLGQCDLMRGWARPAFRSYSVTVVDTFHVGIGDAASVVPESPVLEQNWPNPFNPSTNIAFVLPEAEAVQLTIYDLLGRRVRTLVDAAYPAGRHVVKWDGRDQFGVDVGSGLYFVRMEAGAQTSTRAIMKLK